MRKSLSRAEAERLAELAPYDDIDLDLHFRSPLLREGLAYWRTCRGTGATLDRNSFDFVCIARQMKNAYLAEWLGPTAPDGGDDYRWRLIGTGITEKAGQDATGTVFSDVFDARMMTSYRNLYALARGWAEPYRAVGTFKPYLDKQFFIFEAAVLPFSIEPGGEIRQILTLFDFGIITKADLPPKLLKTISWRDAAPAH
ncbi:hypothetical protein [Parvibaculum sp.]|jgi:hypothetical protein|uniref:hypothetical protein n=1 Tax=Parvibaculum sp. TaxID=2024848 RepID=UPI002FDB968A